jgi:hypothetical protein
VRGIFASASALPVPMRMTRIESKNFAAAWCSCFAAFPFKAGTQSAPFNMIFSADFLCVSVASAVTAAPW